MAMTRLSSSLLGTEVQVPLSKSNTKIPINVVDTKDVNDDSSPVVDDSAMQMDFTVAGNTKDINTQSGINLYALNLSRYSDSGDHFTVQYNESEKILRVSVVNNPMNARKIGETKKVRLNSIINDLIGVSSPFTAQQYWYNSKPVVDVFFGEGNFPILEDHQLELADVSVPVASIIVGSTGATQSNVEVILPRNITASLAKSGFSYLSLKYNVPALAVRVDMVEHEAPGLYNFTPNNNGTLILKNVVLPNTLVEAVTGQSQSANSRRVESLTTLHSVISF